MKIILFGLLALSSLLVVACDGKKEETKEDEKSNITVTETENKITLKRTSTQTGLTFVTTYEWNFEDGICTTSYITNNYPSIDVAKDAYSEILNGNPEDVDNYTLKGRNIIYDQSGLYAGSTKEQVRTVVERIKKSLE